jgi:hypothetical protein
MYANKQGLVYHPIPSHPVCLSVCVYVSTGTQWADKCEKRDYSAVDEADAYLPLDTGN